MTEETLKCPFCEYNLFSYKGTKPKLYQCYHCSYFMKDSSEEIIKKVKDLIIEFKEKSYALGYENGYNKRKSQSYKAAYDQGFKDGYATIKELEK